MESNYKKVLREIKELLIKQNESLEQLTQLFLDKWNGETQVVPALPGTKGGGTPVIVGGNRN